MTKQTSNCARGPGHDHFEAEIVAALWEEVPFPRLPSDAPPELRALVIDIENPRRIYSIHRATRRHNLQLLVEAFIAQLRYGCGYDDCPTASCFSCRRRLAGKAPIRRYSPMSARTLAIHMASQDNPEQYLCPKLELRKGPNDAIKPLIFGPKPRLTRSDIGDSRRFKKSNENAKGATAENLDVFRQFSSMNPEQPSSKSSSTTSRRSQDQHGGTRKGQEEQYGAISSDNDIAKVSISERPVRKDYRSFAANVFGTVTVKMLEWLAPNNLAAISEKGGMSLNSMGQPIVIKAPSNEESDDELFVTSTSSVDLNEATEPARHDLDHTQDNLSPRATNATSSSSDLQRRASLNGTASGGIRPMQQRTNPHARLRTSSKTKSLSTEFISETIIDDSIHMTVPPVSPVSKSSKLAAGPNRSSSGKTHLQRLEHNNDGTSDGHRSRLSQNVPGRRTNEFRNEKSPESANVADNHFDTSFIQDKEVPGPQLEEEVLNSTPNADILPQSISRLSHETIDFLCEVLQQDGTSENHHFEPRTVPRHKRSSRSRVLRRRRTSHSQYPQYLRLEWKLFVEQSIFNVLSDPFAVVESFTTAGSLTDSQTLWYHMLRMTRTAPSLVFDSLWQASATLFAPPKALRFARSPTANVFPRHVQSMSNEEAGVLISVCFHALAAAAPVVHSHSQLFEMSRIRSRGSTLADSGNSESTILSLQYDDAFTDEMAIRLARRVMAAIPTRKYFDELVERDANTEGEAKQTDVLSTLLAHLEPGREVQVSTEFSYSEREVHEKRVPILLLDWARTIMLDEWQGTPDVPGDGPFGGALSLIAAIYGKRKSLLLGDSIFRAEYFGDHLDSIELPVTWLIFDSTREKAHLLDYPFLFDPSSLVTYFRSANFSRMSRSFEESSSLQTRISAIIATDSLVTDQHQKGVLQDMLKIASAKFLVLDIGRKTVIHDTFDQLWRRQERELLRPLKVHLGEDSGEEGFDSGGVQQEFFRLAIAEALNPDYGAFTVDERTRMTWFQPGSPEPVWKFELIGLLISLAVFNGLTLPVTFPKALYMKLLGEPVTELHHIADGWPDLAQGLTTLLEWNESNGTVEDVFSRGYEFSIDMFGQPVSRQMDDSVDVQWPQFSPHSSATTLASGNPDDAPLVTGDNREAYVTEYIRYLTDISVAPQYQAIARGFRTCLHPKSLQLLTPSLLQNIVEGTQEIDIAELRRVTKYVGWDTSHRTIRDFWSIVKKYDDRLKRKLLEFVTASDRVPVGGMRNVTFTIQKNGAEDSADGKGEHLPTAYTCYGIFLLPEYRDKEALRERLGMALENAQGFGFA